MNFDDLKLAPAILKAVHEQGYETPTPIQAQAIPAVLEGHDDSPQQTLVREMAVASAALSYERAGWLRDRLAALQELDDQLARVRDAISRPSGVYAVAGRDGDDRIYLIRQGRVVHEARCTDLDAMTRLQDQAGLPEIQAIGIPADQLDEVLMVEQWFRTRDGVVATVVEALQRLRDAVATTVSPAQPTAPTLP